LPGNPRCCRVRVCRLLAQVAETEYTAFTSKKGQAITARLIVRRVKDLNRQAADGQGELFPVWRYHAIFTDSPFETIQAEEQHRGHAQIEQVFADLAGGPWRTCHIRLVPRQCRLAGLRRHRPQPAARRRLPGQPRQRQSQGRHAAPRPHSRPARIARHGRRPDHPAPARRLAPPGRMDELLEAACSPPAPAPVTASLPPTSAIRQATLKIPGTNPGQAAEK